MDKLAGGPSRPRLRAARVGAILSAALLCLSLAPPPAASARPATRQARDEVPLIRRRYAEIKRRLGRLRRVERDLAGLSAEGGRLVAFFDGDELKALHATFYGETGRALEEYYFDGGRLFFAYTKESRYDKPFGRVVAAPENRFYFRDGRLVRWLDPRGRPVPPARADFASRETNLKESADNLAARARGVKSSRR